MEETFFEFIQKMLGLLIFVMSVVDSDAVNGQWSNWGSWEACSVTCGNGTRHRNRYCNNPAPAYGGYDCLGPNREAVSCNMGHCPVNGQWSNWGSWEACSVTCGNGTRHRNRYCNNPAPANGGYDCLGPNREAVSCNLGHCPVNGQWSYWGSWEGCSVTCGIRRRYRYCNNPTPANGGYYCLGLNVTTEYCNMGHCPEPSKTATSVAGVVTSVFVVFLVAKRTNNIQQNHYETRDNVQAEMHRYDETQRPNRTGTKSLVYVNTTTKITSRDSNMDRTLKMYDIRDFMRILQDKSSMARHIIKEYQVLDSMPIVMPDSDYEIVDIKTGAAAVEDYTHKALVKKRDDGSGYIITTVPDQSDIDNFWTLIINHHVGYIVFLLQKMEMTAALFPSTDEAINTHTFKVEVSSFEKFQNKIFEFALDITNKEENTVVQVRLYKTTDWEVGQAYPCIDAMCKLLDAVSSTKPGMVVFMGSNGIGFPVCGGIGVCYDVLHAIHNETVFSILQTALDLKHSRPNLFQNFEEYNLCYEVIDQLLQNEHTYAVIDEKV